MTGTMELSDQDVQDLVAALDIVDSLDSPSHNDRERIADLKKRLLEVEVNQNKAEI